MKRKKVFFWLRIVLIVYAGFGIALYYFQSRLLFHPVVLPSDYQFTFKIPYSESSIPMNREDTIHMLRFMPDSAEPKGLVVYFHGNMENVNHYADAVTVFTRKGFEVWIPDYPGFGKSRGEMEERKLYRMADQVLKLAASRFGKDSIILYGRSFGTGIASYAASTGRGRLLILESPYYSIPSLFRKYLFMYPLGRILDFEMPVWKYLQQTGCPVVIFHGKSDGVIPFDGTVRLKKFLKPGDDFITIPKGSHNDLSSFPEYQKKMDELLTQ